MPSADAHLDQFEQQRSRLMRIAYRMLGSFSEAEDILQEAWLRWAGVQEEVDSVAAYLTSVVTRLCIDQMRSARVRRETYVGAWLPEPLMGSMDPQDDLAGDLTYTLMMALERLSPLERATFLLHDVFGVALGEVAATLGRDPAAVRQLAVRARRHVRSPRPRFQLDPSEAERIAQAFFNATREGDSAALSAMLAENVVIHADGGGRVTAFRNAIAGVERALRLFVGLARKASYSPKLLRLTTIDGLPGYVSIDRNDVLQTTALEIEDGRITAIYIVRNPDKLRHVATALGIAQHAHAG